MEWDIGEGRAGERINQHIFNSFECLMQKKKKNGARLLKTNDVVS